MDDQTFKKKPMPCFEYTLAENCVNSIVQKIKSSSRQLIAIWTLDTSLDSSNEILFS